MPDDLPFCVTCGADRVAPETPAVVADRYAISAVLGRGGMGTVLRATDRRCGVEVAVKVLHAERAAEPTALARWRLEVEALSRVRHPNLIAVLDSGELPGDPPRPFFVMPLLPGEPLDQVVARGALSTRRAVAVVRGVLAAAAALHAAGFVHRDIKAGNVLLCPGDRPVLLDLGVVRPVARDAALTAHGALVGSLEALAPEQLAGDAIDARTDVYQAGALLVHLLLGELAFDAESTQSWVAAHAGGVGLAGRVAAMPEALAQVCLRAMAVAPEERYASAAEMSVALEQATAGRWGGLRRALFG